jgi:hypothetical protein
MQRRSYSIIDKASKGLFDQPDQPVDLLALGA